SETADEPEADGVDEVDWESYLQDASDAGTVPTPERQEERFEPVNIVELTLADVLREQLYVKKLGPEDEAVMEFILGSLDERGYLTLTNEEIVAHTSTEPERVDRLVGMLQDCEPAGVGARDLRECLLLQLDQNENGTSDLAKRIVEEHWDSLKNRRLPDISRALHVA